MNITKAVKLCVCVLISLSVIFAYVGYARLTDDLSIEGTVNIHEIEGLYIYDYTLEDQYRDNVSVTGHIGTVLSSTVTLKEASGGTNNVTHTVIIYNNTQNTYYFDNVTPVTHNYDNTNIEFSAAVTKSADSGEPDKIGPGEQMEISVTFKFAAGASTSNPILNSKLSYNFLLEKASIEEAIIDVISKFKAILNDDVDIGYLLTHIDDKYDGTDWKATFIGNVVGSSLEDTTHLSYLFEAHLNLIINGVKTPITLIIKMENIDGDVNTGCMYHSTYTTSSGQVKETSGQGCELSLYITTDNISNTTNHARANPVYAVVFTCQTTYTRDGQGNILSAEYGEWIQLGDKRVDNGMYTGTAEIVGYEGNETIDGVYISRGSFNTGDWKLTDSYTMSDGSVVSANATIQTVLSRYLAVHGYNTIFPDGTIYPDGKKQ